MFRKGLFLLLFVSFLGVGVIHAEQMTNISVKSVIAQILQEQGLTNGQKIDAGKVSPKLLESLGDAVMEERIGNPAAHKQMDEAMGGEGSATLAVMHQRMGYNYLTGQTLGMMGMMGYAGTNTHLGGCPMMGNYGNGFYPHIAGWFPWGGIVIGLLFIIVIAVAVFVIVKAIKGSGTTGHTPNESALDILKKRYAIGEITKEQYDTIKKDL